MWTAGLAPHPFVAESSLPKDGRGWVTVDAHLRVPGFPGVWALGDCARVPDVLHPGHHQPALAQHAMRAADQRAPNIGASIRGARTRPFRYRTLGDRATLGRVNGSGLGGPFRVWGLLAWFLWRTYYLWPLPRLEKRLRVAMDWTRDLMFGRDIAVIPTRTASDRYP